MATPRVSGTAQRTKKPMETHFIGRGWLNKTNDGREFINCTIDKPAKGKDPIVLNNIGDDCSFQLWPNTKRTGINPKTNKEYDDADYRLSLLIPKE